MTVQLFRGLNCPQETSVSLQHLYKDLSVTELPFKSLWGVSKIHWAKYEPPVFVLL